MENLAFGLTMLLVGMGGTLLTLFLVAALIRALTSAFPPAEENEPQE
jgi:Na+-transporting methylmalonyl-CoA/oxaloacetate decarboxylase gamma subunit